MNNTLVKFTWVSSRSFIFQASTPAAVTVQTSTSIRKTFWNTLFFFFVLTWNTGFVTFKLFNIPINTRVRIYLCTIFIYHPSVNNIRKYVFVVLLALLGSTNLKWKHFLKKSIKPFFLHPYFWDWKSHE